eukprot:jgi/Undpi1/7067/HiC_scaffold_21.g09541.m1
MEAIGLDSPEFTYISDGYRQQRKAQWTGAPKAAVNANVACAVDQVRREEECEFAEESWSRGITPPPPDVLPVAKGQAPSQAYAGPPFSVTGKEQLAYEVKIEAALIAERFFPGVEEFTRQVFNFIIICIREGNNLQTVAQGTGLLFPHGSAEGVYHVAPGAVAYAANAMDI